MNCPACKNSMVILELDQVEIDFCTSCKGIWLDQGELELLLASNFDTTNKDIFKPSSLTAEIKRRCPICRRKMLKVDYNNSGVMLDKCGKNHGLWFDKGELYSIIAADTDDNSDLVRLLKDIFKE